MLFLASFSILKAILIFLESQGFRHLHMNLCFISGALLPMVWTFLLLFQYSFHFLWVINKLDMNLTCVAYVKH